MNVLSWLVYIPLQILFIPLSIVGLMLSVYRQMIVSRKLELSSTAIKVLINRWVMHIFGVREDEATKKLAAVLPNTSTIGLWLVLTPLWIKYKISGRKALFPSAPKVGKESLASAVIDRTHYFDRIVQRALTDADQFVILGAGYDTRAYGNLMDGSVKVFEVDQSRIQEHKLASLNVAGIACDHITFIAVDFETDNLFEKSVAAGYDPSRKTVFLWEGVTLYLNEEAVRKTMQAISVNAAYGSVLVLDIYAERLLRNFKSGYGKKAMEFTKEFAAFCLDFSENHEEVLAQFVDSESFRLGETFFFDRENEKGPFMVVAEMVTKRNRDTNKIIRSNKGDGE